MANSSVSDAEAFYDYGPLLSRNGVFNIAVGARGNGKTYGAKKWAIKDFIKSGNEFIYLRRYKTELKSFATFFSDISHEFPDYRFRVVGNYAQCSERKDKAGKTIPDKQLVWKNMGYACALSNAVTNKSTAYPKVTKIIYDEFIIRQGHVRYITDEVTAFMEFYSTVDRWQDKTRVLFLANDVTVYNPYFIDWDIEPHGEEWITRHDGFIVANFIKGVSFANAVFKTRFGQFIKGSEYAHYAVDGEFSDATNPLMKKKPASAELWFAIESPTGKFTVWRESSITPGGAVWYIALKAYNTSPERYTMLRENVAVGTHFLEYSNGYLTMLRNAYQTGRLFFDSNKARSAFMGVYRRAA